MFDGAKLKVEWANRQISELSAVVDGYTQRSPYVLKMILDAASGQRGLFCDVKEIVPTAIPLIIGDIGHNLRSALDILANDVVERDSGNRGKSEARFPIYNDPGVFEDAGKKAVKGANSSSFAIFESVQPYKSGDSTLRKLHDLNIGDKHKLVTPMANFLIAGGFKAVQVGTGGTMTIGRARPVDITKIGVHSLGISWHSSLGFEFQDQAEVSIEIRFGPDDSWQIPDISAVETMKRMSKAVANTINLFS